MRAMGTTLAPPATLIGFPEFATTLEASLKKGDQTEVDDLVRSLNDAVTDTVSDGDLKTITGLASRVARLARRLTNVGEPGPRAESVRSLQQMLSTLERAHLKVVLRRNSARLDDEVAGLRHRIVQQLTSGPSRPFTLAETLRVDPTQISRALHDLLDSGHVILAAAPADINDKRAHWYGLAAAEDAPVEVDATTVHISRSRVQAIAVWDADGGATVVTDAGDQAPEPVRRQFVAAIERAYAADKLR